MHTTTIRKNDLLEILGKNRELHRKEYEEALLGFQKKVVDSLQENLGNYIFESSAGKGEPKMKVGDVVIAGRNAFRITGVYLGGVGTQNLVGLESLYLATGYAHGGPIKEMFVPEELVLTAGVYRRVD